MNQAQVKPLKYDGPPLPTTSWDGLRNFAATARVEAKHISRILNEGNR